MRSKDVFFFLTSLLLFALKLVCLIKLVFRLLSKGKIFHTYTNRAAPGAASTVSLLAFLLSFFYYFA